MTTYVLSVDTNVGGIVIPLCSATFLEAIEAVWLIKKYANRFEVALNEALGGVLKEAILARQILALNVGEEFTAPFGVNGEIKLVRTE